MTRYVIVASDGNPDYEFYLPLVEWAWERLGWRPVTLREKPFSPYRPLTIAQVSRLYAAARPEFKDSDLLMTSDADMIPLSDYWDPNPDAITTYGHDLTDYRHVPICYIAMTAGNWREVMSLRGHDMRTAMERDLPGTKALSDEWPDWWLVDQDLITARLKTRVLTSIVRGREPGSYLALGRLDRVDWRYPRTLVDLHAPKSGWDHWPRIVQAVTRAFGTFPEHLVHHDEDFVRGHRRDDASTDPGRVVSAGGGSRAGHPQVMAPGSDRTVGPSPGASEGAGAARSGVPEIRFSGLVFTFNEAGRLASCLRSLQFCDELLVVDLGSGDASVSIAHAAGAEVISHARVPIPEVLWEEMFARLRNDWVVLADPDEVMPPDLARHLGETIAREPEAGLIYVPIRFYFRERPLVNTFWGHVGVKPSVVHRRRVRATGRVHGGVELLPGHAASFLRGPEGWHIDHYWMDSYRQLFEKHRRYLRLEGEARYGRGERFSWRLSTWMVRDALKRNLLAYGGLRGGPRDWFLSVFHTWYVGMSMLSLRRYQRRLTRPHGGPPAA